MIAGFVRGLSVRDVEATVADALGPNATLSKSEVSRICQLIRDELTAWSTRRLDGLTLDYLFLDGSHFRYHVGAAAEPVLAAWGISTDGKPVLVGIGAADSESGDAWTDFLTDLGERTVLPAAGHLRRGVRADRCRRADDGCRASATVSDPSEP